MVILVVPSRAGLVVVFYVCRSDVCSTGGRASGTRAGGKRVYDVTNVNHECMSPC